MATPVMNSYQVDRRAFPLTLYRVDYPGAQATYSRQSGFQAAGNFTPCYAQGLRNSVGYHLDWRSRMKSPFISAFSNREHAHNWARVWRENNGYKHCLIMVISIKADHGVVVFRVADLVDRLGISTSLEPSQYESEYLCFRRIPPEAILRMEAVSYPGMEPKITSIRIRCF